MKERLAKEIRQLGLWPAGATVLLFAVPPFLESERLIKAVLLLYVLTAVVAPSARLFGAEFDQRTIEGLLSQPIARGRIWREKLRAGSRPPWHSPPSNSRAFCSSAIRCINSHDLDSSTGVDLVLCLVAFAMGPGVTVRRQSFLYLGRRQPSGIAI
jgi:hypothetical protein